MEFIDDREKIIEDHIKEEEEKLRKCNLVV